MKDAGMSDEELVKAMENLCRGGKNILFSGTATKSVKIFCELSTEILYNLH
jgi:hypothetical protein